MLQRLGRTVVQPVVRLWLATAELTHPTSQPLLVTVQQLQPQLRANWIRLIAVRGILRET